MSGRGRRHIPRLDHPLGLESNHPPAGYAGLRDPCEPWVSPGDHSPRITGGLATPGPILAVDLGRYKGVACASRPPIREAAFRNRER